MLSNYRWDSILLSIAILKKCMFVCTFTDKDTSVRDGLLVFFFLVLPLLALGAFVFFRKHELLRRLGLSRRKRSQGYQWVQTHPKLNMSKSSLDFPNNPTHSLLFPGLMAELQSIPAELRLPEHSRRLLTGATATTSSKMGLVSLVEILCLCVLILLKLRLNKRRKWEGVFH